MSPIQIVFLIIVIIFLFRFLKNYLRFRRMVDLVPGPKVHSILLGNLPEFWNQHSLIKNETTYNKLKYTYLFSMRMFNEYREKGALRIWLGPYCPMIWLTNADNAEILLSSPYNIDKAGFYRFLKPWLGDGLLLAASHIWRPRRKILTSAFHFKILENFLQTFDHHTKHLLKQIDRNTIDGQQQQQQQQTTILIHDIRLIYEDFTMNVINETAMGIELNVNPCDDDDDAVNHKDDSGGKIPNPSGEKMDSNEDYCMALKQAFRRASNRVLWPINWFDTVFKMTKAGKYFFNTIETINRYSDKVIQKRVGELRTAVEQEAKEAKIFLDILLQHYLSGSQPPLSEQSIRSEVNTFILGGHDTTAMALTFSTMLLGQHQDCQEKARQEVEEILSSASLEVKDGVDICWTMAQLKSMKYLEMCIKETLRLYPSIQILGRTLTKPLVLKDGHTTIPPQTQCFIPIFSLHRDEHYFPEPERFNPERFAQPLKHPFAFIPFSAGPRNCIGQKYAMLEIKYVLATLLIKYRIMSITNQKDVYPEFSPVFKPCIKIAVQFEPRSNRTDGTL